MDLGEVFRKAVSKAADKEMEQRRAVAVARCSRTYKDFEVLFVEGADDEWLVYGARIATQVDETPEDSAAFSGAPDREEEISNPTIMPEYSGCPHCRNPKLLCAKARNFSCWNGWSTTHECPWDYRVYRVGGYADKAYGRRAGILAPFAKHLGWNQIKRLANEAKKLLE